eukprot:CAMPEP_0178797094 /NCGR_PEP_ID=MMETSP0745-20121128/11028_1 /TAXON_ID=913974 /ORGANISM="Nitzschia punctata, Strain CCMP561" /LENGTH=58 /DNA_ID=CAMNT_0020455635 /DNA_START=473 /DNA_END=645 /DNA_ORIENTATION=-
MGIQYLVKTYKTKARTTMSTLDEIGSQKGSALQNHSGQDTKKVGFVEKMTTCVDHFFV